MDGVTAEEYERDLEGIGLCMIQLLARKEQVKARDPDKLTSIATVLRIVRQMMQRDAAVPKRSECFINKLAQAVTDLSHETRTARGMVQTLPNMSINVMYRVCAPLEPWFDKTWNPGDFELVE